MARAAIAGPARTCIVHGAVQSPEAMMRFVLDPDRKVVPDLKGNLPGRGVWVTANREDVNLAARKGLFSRGFGIKVAAEEGLADRVEALLESQSMQALSLASKAGLVITGFEKVQAAIAKKEARAVLFASDGAADGVRKLRARIRKSVEPGKTSPVATGQNLNSAQMGLALGRSNVIHAALLRGGASELCLKTLRRLGRFRAECSVLSEGQSDQPGLAAGDMTQCEQN
ncbi:MAG: RNA-binding protein [Rhizobiales bacterium]|nr:RNA-binding protein [Hyphomicrobiales bacterium]